VWSNRGNTPWKLGVNKKGIYCVLGVKQKKLNGLTFNVTGKKCSNQFIRAFIISLPRQGLGGGRGVKLFLPNSKNNTKKSNLICFFFLVLKNMSYKVTTASHGSIF